MPSQCVINADKGVSKLYVSLALLFYFTQLISFTCSCLTPSKSAKSKSGSSNQSKDRLVLFCFSLFTSYTFLFCRSPNKDPALMPLVKIEYESDTIPSPELGVLPPTWSKGKNRACLISPINIMRFLQMLLRRSKQLPLLLPVYCVYFFQ